MPTPREPDPGALAEVAEIVRALEDGVAVVGPDGVQTQVSDRLCEMTGFAREELLGAVPPFPYWPPEEIPVIEAALQRTLGVDGPVGHRLTFMRRSGERFAVEVVSAPVRDRSGVRLGFTGTVRDLEARRRAEQALLDREQRFRALADQAPAMLWTADAEGATTYVSDRWLRFRGRTLHQELDDGWLEGVHPEERPYVLTEMRNAVGRRRPLSVEYRVRRAEGDYRWIADSAVPREVDGRVVGFIGSRVDITDRRAAEEELRQREAGYRALSREHAALRRVATAVAGGAEAEEVLGLVAAEAGGLISADATRVLRFAEDGAVVMGSWGRATVALGEHIDLAGKPALDQVHRTGRLARIDDYEALRRDEPGRAGGVPLNYRAGVAAPVVAGGRMWGALFVARVAPGEPFAREDERRLSEFADLAGLAVANADALGRLARQARTDPLTGLANHRVFHERLEAEGARALRHGRPLALAVLDLDHFKRVNDTYGHGVGDQVLCEVARRLTDLAREGEMVARIGGEELAWILPETDGTGALAAAERARAAIAEHPFPVVGRVTISAGVADLAQAHSPGAMMTLADGALYWAKARGRNRACRYTPELVSQMSSPERVRQVERERALGALRSLALVNDARHGAASGHADRVADLAAQLAAELGWAEADIARLTEVAVLHDIGTIGLSAAELDLGVSGDGAREHPTLGAEMVRTVLSPDQVRWLRGHHERFDGGGFPDRLSGEAIPEGARILALAEGWEAMTWLAAPGARRSSAAALEESRRQAGRAYCPTVVTALERIAAAGELPE